MTSGYRQTEYAFEVRKCVEGFESRGRDGVEWDFLAVEAGMKGVGSQYKYVSRLLGVSGNLAFKIWKLRRPLRVLAITLAAALFILVVWAAWKFGDSVLVQAVTVSSVFMLLVSVTLTALGSALIGKKLLGIERLSERMYRVAFGFFLAVIGWVPAWLHLLIFDSMFLREGSIENYARRFRLRINRPNDKAGRQAPAAPACQPDESQDDKTSLLMTRPVPPPVEEAAPTRSARAVKGRRASETWTLRAARTSRRRSNPFPTTSIRTREED
jgi:hypothetical protein